MASPAPWPSCADSAACHLQAKCIQAPCGGSQDPATSIPWSDPRCSAQKPGYDDTITPINPNTGCQYFHNKVQASDGLDKCVPCGWPNNMCEQECIYAIEFVPVKSPRLPAGTFAVRPEFRTGGDQGLLVRFAWLRRARASACLHWRHTVGAAMICLWRARASWRFRALL